MSRQARLLAPFLFGILASSAAAQAPAEPRRLSASEFAILPWGGAPGDKEALAGIRDCGFNLAGFVSPANVEAVGAAGLQCLVSDPSTHVGDAEAGLDEAEIAKRVKPVAERFRDNPAVFGYYLRDEPHAGLYAGLARWAAAFEAAAPKQLPYINLFPNVANAQQLQSKSYDDYVESFVRIVKPKFVSYDHYALMDDGSLKDGYFQNLESVRRVSLANNLPFWNIVLGNSHFRYAEPSENGLRFQMYTTLAYGARGISYFTYFTPSTGNYRLGAIDQFGNKTPTWDLLRRVNLQLHRLGPTYIQLKSVNVFHHPTVPAGCAKIESSKIVAEVQGGEFVVGEFEGPQGRPYALVVNKDLHRSTTLGIRFKQPGGIQMINAYTGAPQAWSGENVWMAPGQGMLLTIAK